MSVAAITWVLTNSEAQLGARLVMIAIADEANAEGRNAWPSIERIAHHTRLSVRNVKRILAKLKKTTELIIERGGGPHGVHSYVLPLVNPSSSGATVANYANDAASPQRGDILTPQAGVTTPAGTGDKSSRKGVTLRHPTQVQTRKRDPLTSEKNSKTSLSKSIDNDNDKEQGCSKNNGDLLSLLEINIDRIPRADLHAMKYLTRAFAHECPRPDDASIAAWLDAKIKWLTGDGQRYPKVALARLKQIQRGQFTVEATENEN